MKGFNQVDPRLARQLMQQQESQQPPTKKQQAFMRNISLNEMAASFIPSIINSRKELNEDEVIEFAYKVASSVMEKVEDGKRKIEELE